MLKFYGYDFEFLFAEPHCISTRWNLAYNGTGTFEAHLPFSSDAVRLASENPYLVVKEGANTALVTGYAADGDFALYGRTCNFLLSKRVTKAFGTKSGTADSVARDIVSAAFEDVQNFTLGEALNLSESIDFTKNDNLLTSEAVKGCLKMQSLGHEVVFDTANKQWVYKSLMGRELDLIFSEANKNAFDARFTCDILDLADCGYYEKQTEQDGVKSTETAYIGTEGTKSGIYRWEALLNSKSEAEAQSELSRQSARNEASLKVRSAVFGKDFCLGDIVRVQIIKGSLRKTVKKRISAVEIQSRNGFEITQPVFEEV